MAMTINTPQSPPVIAAVAHQAPAGGTNCISHSSDNTTI